MQSKANQSTSAIDTRSFFQIWQGLNPSERTKVKSACLYHGCANAEKTIYNWGNGVTSPALNVVRNQVVRILQREINIKTTPATLFPNS